MKSIFKELISWMLNACNVSDITMNKEYFLEITAEKDGKKYRITVQEDGEDV